MPANAFSLRCSCSVVALLVIQPDFGQTMLVVLVWSALFFMAGMRLIWVFGLAGIAGVGLTAAYFTVPHVARRIQKFPQPASGDTFNIDIATESFMRGGWFGRGPGEGTVKRLLPESHTDFVFAVAAEEFGVALCLVLVALYAFIVIRALARAHAQRRRRSRALPPPGLAILFGMQSAINMAVNLHLIPAKGMTLPFISYGGSSMISLAYAMGMLLALTREQPRAAMLTRSRRMAACPASAAGVVGEMPAGGQRRGARLILLAAGGTGGHLFPAEALADALAKRGAPSISPPMRAPPISEFPARAVHLIPSATLRGRNPFALARTAALLALGTAKAWSLIGRIEPAVVVGFGGYPTVPPLLAAHVARHADRAARAERRHGPRQPLAGAARHAPSPPAFARCAARCAPAAKVDLHRQSGATRGDRGGGHALRRAGCRRTVRPCWCSAAARAPASWPRSCRRRSSDSARPCARACRSCSRRASKTSTPCAGIYSRIGVAAEMRAVLRRPAGAYGGRASRHLALRRLDGRRVIGDRPARHSGAAAACARSGPARQCRRAGTSRGRDSARAARFHP